MNGVVLLRREISQQRNKKGKDQESIQSSTFPDPGYQWEIEIFTIRHYKREPKVSPFPAGDHKASINRRTRKHNRININDPQKRTSLERSVKYFTGGLTQVSRRANLTLSSDVNQDTKMFDLHERPLTYQCSISKNIKRR